MLESRLEMMVVRPLPFAFKQKFGRDRADNAMLESHLEILVVSPRPCAFKKKIESDTADGGVLECHLEIMVVLYPRCKMRRERCVSEKKESGDIPAQSAVGRGVLMAYDGGKKVVRLSRSRKLAAAARSPEIFSPCPGPVF